MALVQVMFCSLGILMIALGLLHFRKPFALWQLKWKASRMGVQSKITNQSIQHLKIAGSGLLILGIFFLALGLMLPNFIN